MSICQVLSYKFSHAGGRRGENNWHPMSLLTGNYFRFHLVIIENRNTPEFRHQSGRLVFLNIESFCQINLKWLHLTTPVYSKHSDYLWIDLGTFLNLLRPAEHIYISLSDVEMSLLAIPDIWTQKLVGHNSWNHNWNQGQLCWRE